ncbi:MAG: nicotinate (nicotinamide) nucleotide adenylyltransferase [Armatimonadetes bacterium]|nr:nicotinate (nicotinamide) nucleotide adenylyltransferase [Armatimonadota bacterium]
MTTPRLGLFGGTFDPPHRGHLALAEHCLRALSLDAVWWIPCGQPALKQHAAASAEQRRAMVELAIAGRPEFALCDVELRRQGTSYTVDTLAEIADQHDRLHLWWLMGLDALVDFPRWREPRRIVSLVRLAVVDRPGDESDQVRSSLPQWLADRVDWVPMPLVDAASRTIRAESAQGPTSRLGLPDSVAEYIAKHRLYTAA